MAKNVLMTKKELFDHPDARKYIEALVRVAQTYVNDTTDTAPASCVLVARTFLEKLGIDWKPERKEQEHET